MSTRTRKRPARSPSFFADPGSDHEDATDRAVLVAAIYIAVPKLAGLDDAIALLGEASRRWIGVAILANGRRSARTWRCSAASSALERGRASTGRRATR